MNHQKVSAALSFFMVFVGLPIMFVILDANKEDHKEVHKSKHCDEVIAPSDYIKVYVCDYPWGDHCVMIKSGGTGLAISCREKKAFNPNH